MIITVEYVDGTTKKFMIDRFHINGDLTEVSFLTSSGNKYSFRKTDHKVLRIFTDDFIILETNKCLEMSK